MSDNVNFNIKKKCKSCNAIFQSSALDNEIYCNNCKEDEDALDEYSSSRDWDDIVSFTSCRTSPVFYD